LSSGFSHAKTDQNLKLRGVDRVFSYSNKVGRKFTKPSTSQDDRDKSGAVAVGGVSKNDCTGWHSVITIRHFKDSDAPALVAVFKRAVHEIAARVYSPEQIEAWSKLCPTPDQLCQTMTDGRTTFVAINEDGEPVGFTDLEPDGHIGFLYVSPEIAGTGAVQKLYDALEAKAFELGIGKLYCEASEQAKTFMLKQQFRLVERRDFELCGVPIHNYAVEKRLRP
jgi:putative acetyltransferase